MAQVNIIRRQKELAIARSELGIQKANSDASVFAAKAIAAKGKAEADVLAAMYRAKAQNREVFLAEVERDIAKDLYTNLKDFKIEMPHNYIGGGGGGGGSPGKLTSNLDVITALGALLRREHQLVAVEHARDAHRLGEERVARLEDEAHHAVLHEPGHERRLASEAPPPWALLKNFHGCQDLHRSI